MCLAAAADQAVALAARWAVLGGAAVGADAASAATSTVPTVSGVHLHLGDDLELALVGAVAVPISGELSAALAVGGAVGGGAVGGGSPSPAPPAASPSLEPPWRPATCSSGSRSGRGSTRASSP